MAEVLKEYEFKGQGFSYPWHEWADGRIWRISQDDLRNTSPVLFRKSLHQVATRLGKKVRSNLDGNTVVFQFFTEPTDG